MTQKTVNAKQETNKIILVMGLSSQPKQVTALCTVLNCGMGLMSGFNRKTIQHGQRLLTCLDNVSWTDVPADDFVGASAGHYQVLLIIIRVELGAEGHLLVGETRNHVPRLHVPELDIPAQTARIPRSGKADENKIYQIFFSLKDIPAQIPLFRCWHSLHK